MTKPMLMPAVDSVAVAALSVTVVDGNGIEVHGEPVTARFDLGEGREYAVTRRTGADGAAHFVEDLAGPAHGVTLSTGRESVGPLRPAAGAHLVIET